MNNKTGIYKLSDSIQSAPAVAIFHGQNILQAEDMAINRKIFSVILESMYLQVDSAENGKKAVMMFCENPWKYSLIFMDMEMPEMGGCEATRKIRSLNIPRAREIPIIAMTSHCSQEDINKCLMAGMNAHLTKPYEQDKIAEVLKKYLSAD